METIKLILKVIVATYYLICVIWGANKMLLPSEDVHQITELFVIEAIGSVAILAILYDNLKLRILSSILNSLYLIGVTYWLLNNNDILYVVFYVITLCVVLITNGIFIHENKKA